MISFFRRFFQSRIGLPIFIAFLALIALAFAAADITGSAFGGVSGGDRVALVGDDKIAASELLGAANSALEQVRQQNPTVTMPELIEQGMLDEVMSQLVDRSAIGAYAEKYGLRAGDNLVNSEILKIPAFRGLTGEFDEEAYRAALSQRGLTDAVLRRDLRDGLLEQQLLKPVLAAPRMPEKVARRYASLVLERRRGEIALIPSLAFAPSADPTPAQLQAWYDDNRSQFIRPERRTLRFAVFGTDQLDVDATPTPAEIAARYKRDAAQYAAGERRAVTSFVVPTEDAAKAFAVRIRAGLSLEAAAREAGFSASAGDVLDRESLSNATSFAFAQNVFRAAEGGVVEPSRGTLGWYVARVDRVERTPARSLEQVSSGIAEQLTSEKRAAAVAELTSEIEAEVDSGTALAEVAETYDLTVERTPALLADGQVFGNPQGRIVPELAPVLATAFQMEESEPQLAEIVPGEQFIIYDVERVEEASAPPLAEVREQAVTGWKRAQGAKLARAAADRIKAKLAKGTPLAEALAAENKPGLEREAIDLERRELLAQRQRNLPPPLVLLFSMAEKTTKVLEAPRDLGWYVVSLEEIATDPVESEPTLLAQTQQQLAPTLGEEYRRQLNVAIRKEIGVEQNADAIEAVRKQLAGES